MIDGNQAAKGSAKNFHRASMFPNRLDLCFSTV